MEKKIEHPSFGNIQISRVQSSKGKTLFGSGAKHSNYVVISVGSSNYSRKYSNEWIHPKKTYVEIAMSEAQFAQFIMSVNLGSGVPCTLQYVMGEEMADCPDLGMRKQFDKDVQESLAGLQEQMNKLKEITSELSNKPKLTKEDRQNLKDAVDAAKRAVDSDISWIQEQFDEAMDKSVNAAKIEAETHAAMIINNIGLEAIRVKQLRINEDNG